MTSQFVFNLLICHQEETFLKVYSLTGKVDPLCELVSATPTFSGLSRL